MTTTALKLLTKHNDLSRQYGCAATMTVATFVFGGMLHRARRFWRSDLPTSGQIEIYVLEPWAGATYTTMTEQGWYDSAACEDFVRYASRDGNVLDQIAVEMVRIVRDAYVGTVASQLDADQSARFAAIELH